MEDKKYPEIPENEYVVSLEEMIIKNTAIGDKLNWKLRIKEPTRKNALLWSWSDLEGNFKWVTRKNLELCGFKIDATDNFKEDVQKIIDLIKPTEITFTVKLFYKKVGEKRYQNIYFLESGSKYVYENKDNSTVKDSLDVKPDENGNFDFGDNSVDEDVPF